MSGGSGLVRCSFEVFGKVQGVFFRKHTQQQAKALGLTGWCRNTAEGTVTGSIEGPRASVEEMKRWLRTEGSPRSRIDSATFQEESIAAASFRTFEIIRE